MSKRSWPSVADQFQVNRGILGASNRAYADANGHAIFDPHAGVVPGGASSRNAKMVAEWLRAIVFAPRGLAQLAVQDETLKRVLSSTDVDGGYLIPPGFFPELVQDVPKLSQLFQFVRQIPVGTPTGTMPVVGSNVTLQWGTENTDATETPPTFGDLEWAVKRLQGLIKMSRELFADANPDIVATVQQMFTLALAEERDRVIAVGTGSGQPLGIYSASGITDVSSITTLTYSNLVKLKESLDERYQNRPATRWTMNQKVKAAVAQILDGIGRPIFIRDATTGWVPMLLGTPVSIERSFPNNYIGIGDLSFYYFFDRQQMALESTTEASDAFTKHQIWLKLMLRVDGKPALPPTVPFVRARNITGVT